jgi:ATP-dependent helicase HrpA
MDPFNLPVYNQKEKILKKLKESQVIVVESPTGSGKTTQIPQILYEEGYADKGIIGITQPRRIAAVSVSEFIQQQIKEKKQDSYSDKIVGYKMRFDDKTDLKTKIKIMTDGILLQEIKADYFLSDYSIIMVDEAHERSLNIDFILGLLKRILVQRSDFKVIISSATINAEIFSEYFDSCPIVRIETRAYPVEINYISVKPDFKYENLIKSITDIVNTEYKNNKSGDILIFLHGQKAINDCINCIDSLNISRNLKILPLYARLSSSDQEKVFYSYPKKKKVIVATNIAETSVTIDGITAVIDSGLCKINYYNQKTFTSSLIEVPISKASCNQRKGRAGRTAPGKCYRLYSKSNYETRPLFTEEEIFRTDLSEVVLRMAEIGIKNFEEFDFISKPGREGILSAIETLRLLNALDNNRNLTSTGRMMINFPMLPKHSRIIVEAINRYPDVLEEVIIASSFLTTSSPLLLPQGEEMDARNAHHYFRDPYGDFISYLKIYRGFLNSKDRKSYCKKYYLDPEVMYEIVNIKEQLEEIVSGIGVPISSGGSIKNYLCSVSSGLIQFVCTRTSRGTYKTLTAGRIQIHPGSVMFRESPKYIVAGEIVRTSRTYARSVSKLKEEWIKEISALLYKDINRLEEKSGKKLHDFTNKIKIGTRIFRIVKEKGKKLVLLPWKELKILSRETDSAMVPNYKNLRGTIIYKKYRILHMVKLNSLLEISRKIDISKGILKSWPRKNLIFPDSVNALCFYIEKLLSLCVVKKSKFLGFLTLHSDGNNTFWFKAEKSFFNSLNENLSSLEYLADAGATSLKENNKNYLKIINSKYRKLSSMFE